MQAFFLNRATKSAQLVGPGGKQTVETTASLELHSQLVTAQLGSCGLDSGPCSQYNLRFIIVLNKLYIPKLYSL